MSKKQKKRKKNVVNDAARSNRILIVPKNAKQREYLGYLEREPQVFAIGSAGTGKTYLPVAVACKRYLRGEIKRIIITRPAVAVEEKHGFLPGDIKEKLAPWVMPITEIIESFVGKKRFEEMYAGGDFKVEPFAYMRGRTLDQAFIILDEAQNTTRAQMEMFLTRLGEGSQLAVTGDLKQTDLLAKTSGLYITTELIRKKNLPVPIVSFGNVDVVRSDLCKMWVDAFD